MEISLKVVIDFSPAALEVLRKLTTPPNETAAPVIAEPVITKEGKTKKDKKETTDKPVAETPVVSIDKRMGAQEQTPLTLEDLRGIAVPMSTSKPEWKDAIKAYNTTLGLKSINDVEEAQMPAYLQFLTDLKAKG